MSFTREMIEEAHGMDYFVVGFYIVLYAMAVVVYGPFWLIGWLAVRVAHLAKRVKEGEE